MSKISRSSYFLFWGMFLAAGVLFFFGTDAHAATTDQIEQYGITWHFDKEYENGTFANGDYWVLGPVTINSISRNYSAWSMTIPYKNPYCLPAKDEVNPSAWELYFELSDVDVNVQTEDVSISSVGYYLKKGSGEFSSFVNMNNKGSNLWDTTVPFDNTPNTVWTVRFQMCDNRSPQVCQYYDYKVNVNFDNAERGVNAVGSTVFTRHIDGWQVNPTNTDPQGVDERCGHFSALMVPDLPYQAQPGDSIFKGISRGEDAVSPYLQTATVLTVVSESPPGNGADVFRPGYSGADKTYYYLSDIRTDRLLSISTENLGTTYGDIINHYKMVQVEHKGGSTGRRMRPVDNMKNNYAPYSAGQLNNAIAKFNSTDSLEQKREALIYVIQSGIDRYNAVLTGQTWPAGGGHQSGHKLSVAFSAYMLDHQGMKDVVSDTFWWENKYIRNGLFGFETAESTYWKYVALDPGYNMEYGDPYGYIDGGNNYVRKINSYQIITSNNYKGAACWLRYWPEMKVFWSDADNFIAYAERWVSHGLKALPDPCAPMHPDDVGKASSEWQYYGVTYGPDGKGDCIKGSGRFSDGRDGMYADTGHYQSAQMNEMWLLYESGDSLPGDLNSDGTVNIFDYNIFLQNFGATDCVNVADLNGDCSVNIFDYNILLENFGKTQ